MDVTRNLLNNFYRVMSRALQYPGNLPSSQYFFNSSDSGGLLRSKKKQIMDFTQISPIDNPELKITANENDCLFRDIEKIIENDKEGNEELYDFLDKDNTLEKIMKLSEDEKTLLINTLLSQKKEKCFLTKSGHYLMAQPTSDQKLVGLIGRLMESNLDSLHNLDSLQNLLLYKWDVCTEFRENKASHLPEVFPNTLPQANLGTSNTSYYGRNDYFTEKKPAQKNVSRRCEQCLIHQTDQKEHDKIYHPVVALDIDHEKTKCIYSKDLLNLMTQEGYGAQDKNALLPPVIFQLRGQYAIDFLALNESARLFPEAFLSPTVCQYIKETRDRSFTRFSEHVADKISSSDEQKAMTDIYRAMTDFSRNIPVLAQVGKELKTLLKEKDVPIPDGSISDRYHVKKFAARKSWKNLHEYLYMEETDRNKHLLARCIIDNSRVHPYLSGTKMYGDYFFPKTTSGLLRQAMNNVSVASKSDVRPGSAPVFIGFIPSAIADGIASKHGFLDSLWSGNFLHGEFSHALALTCLTKLAGLNQDMLKTMLENHLWGKILDNNPYTFIDIKPETENLPFLHLNANLAFNYFAHSPFKYQELLSNGQLSKSLNEIKNTISLYGCEKQAALMEKFFTDMGINEQLNTHVDITDRLSAYFQLLQEIIDDITVLEKFLSTEHIRSREQVINSVTWPPDKKKLANPEESVPMGEFIIYNSSRYLSQINAKQYLRQGYTVKAVKKRDSKNPEMLDIKEEGDIYKYDSFIAFSQGG